MKQVTIFVEYLIGEAVFLKTDPDQLERIVTSIQIYPGGTSGVIYHLSCGSHNSEHFAIEITKKKKI